MIIKQRLKVPTESPSRMMLQVSYDPTMLPKCTKLTTSCHLSEESVQVFGKIEEQAVSREKKPKGEIECGLPLESRTLWEELVEGSENWAGDS